MAAGAAAAFGTAVASAAQGGGKYQPGPAGAPVPAPTPNTPDMSNMPGMSHAPNAPQAPTSKIPGGGQGDMIMQLPNGKWISHALPFAGPFPDRASLEAEIKRSRAQGLIG